jgi:hypothetical protein
MELLSFNRTKSGASSERFKEPVGKLSFGLLMTGYGTPSGQPEGFLRYFWAPKRRYAAQKRLRENPNPFIFANKNKSLTGSKCNAWK